MYRAYVVGKRLLLFAVLCGCDSANPGDGAAVRGEATTTDVSDADPDTEDASELSPNADTDTDAESDTDADTDTDAESDEERLDPSSDDAGDPPPNETDVEQQNPPATPDGDDSQLEDETAESTCVLPNADDCWDSNDCAVGSWCRIGDAQCNGVPPIGEGPLPCNQGGSCLERYACNPETGACDPVPCVSDETCLGVRLCDPTNPEADIFGCRRPRCNAGEYECSDGQPLCDETTGFCHAPGYTCTDNGCTPIHCAQPGGVECGTGRGCDEGLGADGCRTLHCSEPGGNPCGDLFICDADTSGWGCVQCFSDDDCDCGLCLHKQCHQSPAPGRCVPNCG